MQEFKLGGVLHIKTKGGSVFRILEKSYGWGVYALYDDEAAIYMPFETENAAKNFLIEEIEKILNS